MELTTINEENDFSTWGTEIITELNKTAFSDFLGNLLFENEKLKLWDLTLEPNERIPFTKRNTLYTFNCLTDGLLLTRMGTGQIDLIRFKKGESRTCDTQKKAVVKDMQNVGGEIIKMLIVEIK